MDERGGGPISMWIGFSVFLVLLLFAVQVLFNLYATSVLTAVSFDAARRVAGGGGGPAVIAAAEDQARAELGRYGTRVTFDWSATDADEIVLHVEASNPHVLLPVLAGPVVVDDINRVI